MEDTVIEYVNRDAAMDEPTDNPRVRVEMNLSLLESIIWWSMVAAGEGVRVDYYTYDVEAMRDFIDAHSALLKSAGR